MRWLRALHVRLTLVFLAILLALGAFCLWLAESSARTHSLEHTQRLNRSVARYMVETGAFADAEGLRGEALAELAPHVMTINPSAAVYLLDTAGEIVAQPDVLNSIAPRRVDLGPVRHLLAGDVTYPLLGDDPLDGDESKPFSAWPVSVAGVLHGYVYVVLAGTPHTSWRDALDDSRATRDLAMMLSGALALAGLTGALVFFTLTRRLRELTASVERQPLVAGPHRARRHDELDELAHAYGSLTARLQSQYAKLERSDSDRRRLIASVSHDLRTPLTTLKGYLETLQLGEGRLGAAERERYLAIAHRHACKLGSRVDELFELSRLSTEDIAPRLEHFSLRELAHDCLQDFAPLALERSIALDVAVDAASARGDSLSIEADIALVQRVFENLVDNALRHTAANGRVTLHLQRVAPRTLRVDVVDTGCGMPPEVASRVFDSCWSGHADDRSRGGLGLAIVARAVELHGGRVGVDSRVGIGTRFRVELPTGSPPGSRPSGPSRPGRREGLSGCG